MSSVASLNDTMLALADPTRRAILQMLLKCEARVSDVASPFDMSLNSVSKHIRILERAGLVHRRKQGREYILAADPGPLAAAGEWIDDHRS